MNLRSFFGRHSDSLPPDRLPQVHAFVDVIVGGRPARQVVVEAVDDKGVLLAGTLGRPGETATVVYSTSSGRFRAITRVHSLPGPNTLFERPRQVAMVGASGNGSQKRQSVRLDALVSAQWRFAPGGKGSGEFTRCSIRDISRGGCSVILDRELKHGATIEVRLMLRADVAPLTLLAEVMRHQQIPQSGKHSHGVRFHGVRPDEDQAIVEFINRRQSDLRNRGLA